MNLWFLNRSSCLPQFFMFKVVSRLKTRTKCFCLNERTIPLGSLFISNYPTQHSAQCVLLFITKGDFHKEIFHTTWYSLMFPYQLHFKWYLASLKKHSKILYFRQKSRAECKLFIKPTMKSVLTNILRV